MTPGNADNRLARRLLIAAALSFALFIAHILYGKWLILSGETMGSGLDGVAEFLLLLITVALFMAYTQLRAKARSADDD